MCASLGNFYYLAAGRSWDGVSDAGMFDSEYMYVCSIRIITASAE